ncbi:hypothetical protein Tco_1576147 [Tanacetum coccineum]
MYCLRYDVEASEKLWFIRVPSKTSNKENEDTVPEKEIITDDIYNWITAKYGAPNETWNGDQIALVADDIVKTFFDKSDSKQDVPECSTKDVASPIAATNIVDPQTEVIEISSGTKELEYTSIEELESSSTSKLESSSTEDDSDDEEFLSSSAELVTCKAEDDIDEEAKDDTEDDTDDETWNLINH